MTRKRGLSEGEVRRTPSQPRSTDTVAVVLAGAERLLRSDGMASLTVRAVSRAAGVSPGTIYQYFDGVDAIIERLIDRCTEAVAAASRAGFERALSAPDADWVEHTVRAMVQAHVADAPLRRALIHGRHTRVTARWREAEREAIAALAEVLGQVRPEIAGPRVLATAAVLVGAVEGAIEQAMADPATDLVFAEDLIVELSRRVLARAADPGTGLGPGAPPI